MVKAHMCVFVSELLSQLHFLYSILDVDNTWNPSSVFYCCFGVFSASRCFCNELLLFSFVVPFCACCSAHQWFLSFSVHSKFSGYVSCLCTASDWFPLFSQIYNVPYFRSLEMWVIWYKSRYVLCCLICLDESLNPLTVLSHPCPDLGPKRLQCGVNTEELALSLQ